MSAIQSWVRDILRKSESAVTLVYPHELGVLAIMKNESMNIDEWIEHYLWMGAGQIYLIDNGSTDDTMAKAQKWVERGHLRLVEYPAKYQQTQHYRSAFELFQIDKTCEWLIVADLDEFWFCPAGDRLVDALKGFGNYDVIYSNWVVFGSGGLIEHPASVREGFTQRRAGLSGHNESKYIARTKNLKKPSAINIHKVVGSDSSRTVSDTHRFQLNHYIIQSEAFFRSVKITRGAANTERDEHIRDMDYFQRYDRVCVHLDRKLADLVAAAGKR